MIYTGRALVLAAVTIAAVSVAGCNWHRRQTISYDPSRTYIDAVTTLRQAAEDPDPVTRSNAIEAISQTLGRQAGPVLEQALSDPYPSVRFAAAMAIGDLRYKPASRLLHDMAKSDGGSARAEPDKRVFCAIIYALHQIGDTSYTSQLGRLLCDDEKEVRADAAMVMGRMDEPSAIVPLKVQLADEQDPSVQLQILESLAMLGDKQSAVRLEAHTKSQYMEDRLLAIEAMKRSGSPRTLAVLRNLLSDRQPPRIRVAAAGAMAKCGDTSPELYSLAAHDATEPRAVMTKAYKDRSVSDFEVNSLQRLAAIALGWMGRPEGVNVLRPLLASKHGGVRVAAAMSLVRLLKAYRPTEPVGPEPTKPSARRSKQSPTAPAPRLYTAGGKD